MDIQTLSFVVLLSIIVFVMRYNAFIPLLPNPLIGASFVLVSSLLMKSFCVDKIKKNLDPENLDVTLKHLLDTRK